MAEQGKIRVVRCPKCEKLLPELPDYPVYRCGGCDATLQAKNLVPSVQNRSMEKSDEERIILSENTERISEENGSPLQGASEADLQGKEGPFPEATMNFAGNSSPTRESETSYASRFRRQSKAPVGSNSDDVKAKADKEKKMKTIEETDGQLRMDRQPLNWQLPLHFERDRRTAFRTPRAVTEGVEFSRYPDVGPSSYHPGSDHRYGEAHATPQKTMYLEQDRAEILRKIDELRDQLSRSHNILEKPQENAPVNNRHVVPPSSYVGNHGRWYPGSSSASDSEATRQIHPPDVRRATFFRNEHVPLSRQDLEMQNYYNPALNQNEVLGHGDPYMGAQMLSRGPYQTHQFPQRSSKDYLPGQYHDIDGDPMILYPNNMMYDQSSCSCLNCRNKHLQLPVQGPPPILYDHRLPKTALNHMFHPVERSSAFGPGGYDYRGGDATLWPHARNPSDFEYDAGGGDSRKLHPHRSVDAKGNARMCLPVSGAAPFITCNNCFELLQLPKKLDRNMRKLRCGACSEVISIVFDGKRLVFSALAQARHIPSQITSDSGEMTKQEGLSSHVEEKILNSSDDDGDNTADTRPASSSHPAERRDNVANLSESEDSRELSSTTISSEESLDSMVTHGNVHLIADASSSLPTSPLHGHLGYSPTNKVGGNVGKGSRSNRSEPDKVVLRKGNSNTSRQNSVKDTTVATEMEYSFNEYPNSGVSRDSEDVSREGRPRFSRGGDSFFAGLIKKSFRDFGRSNQLEENGKSSVLVNGHPIPDRLIKKAEKQAGPIHPGHYWYDYRAGFWGPMGHQCLGIIPPFIEEFNHPLPKNCSDGDSGIFVNGRELHHRDLELLASRGLPMTRDMSYTVEISGRVFDEVSGEELECLGKLAPTVEKAKHGFGMRVPRGMA